MWTTVVSIVLSIVFNIVRTSSALPIVDPGLFVISGVSTCGNGTGYCLLGADCTLDQDFTSDPGGHCTGLKGAFTPSAHFVCCKGSVANEIEPTPQPDKNTSFLTSTPAEKQTQTASHQTITSPPDYVETDTEEDAEENRVDWEGAKNVTEGSEMCPSCDPEVVFTLDNRPMCLGTHLGRGWVLTSGACALRVFRAGMVKVIGSFTDEPHLETTVKTISVHEDYRPYSSNLLRPEPNNIGLILMSAEPKTGCVPCLPHKKDKFIGKLCTTLTNATSLYYRIIRQEGSLESGDFCEAVLETMQGEGTEDFYTMACDSNTETRYNGEDENADTGKGLSCRGYLTGIETSSGTGLSVFTSVALFGDWISANMVDSQRQSFNTQQEAITL